MLTLAATALAVSMVGVCGLQAKEVKWAAAWATSMQSAATTDQPELSAISAYSPQPDLAFPFPNGLAHGADDQTFRIIIKPDLWGRVGRLKLSNLFGTQPVTFGAIAVALQQYQANLVVGTSSVVTFEQGRRSLTLHPGQEIFSDPIALKFVGDGRRPTLTGSNLAVSFLVSGSSGPMTYHARALSTNYISPAGSGDATQATDGTSFPYTTASTFFLSEFDIEAPSHTKVIVAFGDSLTDGAFSTFNGYDRWSNVMSQALHKVYGDGVSVVNEGIGGNKVTAGGVGPAALDRLGRDVLGIAGVSAVVWLEGINDLGQGATATQVTAAYQRVISQLHANGVQVIGATLPSAYGPNGQPPANSPLSAISPDFAFGYNDAQTNHQRLQVNHFILSSHRYDAVADFAAVTTDPDTGRLYARFVPNSQGSAGDDVHPNRAGYQVMGLAAAKTLVELYGR